MARQRAAEREGAGRVSASEATRERILAAAEELLRRHGPAKTTVVDVARKLGMSHANVYRHFASKAELQEAIAERWLARVSQPLERIVSQRSTPAPERLTRWLKALVEAKRRKVLEDPEMFANYHLLAEAARGVVERHVEQLRDQVRRILAAGVEEGVFRIRDLDAAAMVVLNASIAFHHPHFVGQQAPGKGVDGLGPLLAVLLEGLARGAL